MTIGTKYIRIIVQSYNSEGWISIIECAAITVRYALVTISSIWEILKWTVFAYICCDTWEIWDAGGVDEAVA